MNNYKIFKLLCLLVLVAGLISVAAPARAEMYVEGYVGGVQGANANLDFRLNAGVTWTNNYFPGRLDPAVMGGLKIGTWFVKEGFLGYNYPEWMKYFGFYLDFSYHRLNFRHQQGFWIHQTAITGFNKFSSEGNAATLAFMFAARYGFLPDSEVPFGRLQPYVAVGPGILFASQQPTIIYPTWSAAKGNGESDSDATICLAAEAGLRWMCLKNVSIAISFKYRFAEPRFNSSFFNPWSFSYDSMTINPTFHLFSGQVGVAYYF